MIFELLSFVGGSYDSLIENLVMFLIIGLFLGGFGWFGEENGLIWGNYF